MVSAEAAAAAEASLARGEEAAARGDNAAALVAFKETLALDPGYTTAQEWVETLSKQSALLQAGSARRRSADAASRARSPSPGRPSLALSATKKGTSWTSTLCPGRLSLCLLLFAVLYDTGQLQDAITALQGNEGDTPPEPSVQDHYAVLHLGPTASTQDIKKAFRERSKDTHPDRCGRDAPPEVCGKVAQEAVNRAHEVLSDDARRRDYDATRSETILQRIDAVTQLVNAWWSGELSPLLALTKIGSATGLGLGTSLWLVWLVLKSTRLTLLTLALGGYYLYSEL